MESGIESSVDLECKQEAGLLTPIIDLNKCEGKADCVKVCPYSVFELRELSLEEYGGLNFFGRLKSVFHGKNKAFAVNASACEACGLCVKACPEKAISLVKTRPKTKLVTEDLN